MVQKGASARMRASMLMLDGLKQLWLQDTTKASSSCKPQLQQLPLLVTAECGWRTAPARHD
jgi:hypothetical protein